MENIKISPYYLGFILKTITFDDSDFQFSFGKDFY